MLFFNIKINKFIDIIKKNDINKVKEAIKKVKDINETFSFNKPEFTIDHATALIIAIINNVDIEIIKLLVEKGADVNYEDENKNTPFLYSTLYYKNPDILDFLIKKGADPNHKNILGANALMISLYNDEVKILNKVIELKADVNSQNRGGWSGFMSIAIDKRPIEYAKILVENGADINLKNKSGDNALDIAIKFNNTEMVNYIELLNKKY